MRDFFPTWRNFWHSFRRGSFGSISDRFGKFSMPSGWPFEALHNPSVPVSIRHKRWVWTIKNRSVELHQIISASWKYFLKILRSKLVRIGEKSDQVKGGPCWQKIHRIHHFWGQIFTRRSCAWKEILCVSRNWPIFAQLVSFASPVRNNGTLRSF